MTNLSIKQLEKQKRSINEVFAAYKALTGDQASTILNNKRMVAGFILSFAVGIICSAIASWAELDKLLRLAFIFTASFGFYNIFMIKSELPRDACENMIAVLRNYKPLNDAPYHNLMKSLRECDGVDKEKIKKWLDSENGSLIELNHQNRLLPI